MASNASHMLEAALEQMDDIIAGKMDEGLFTALMQIEDQDCPASECTSHLTLDPVVDHALKALQLTEALRGVLEGQGSEQEQHSLRKQVSTETAHIILKWLHRDEEAPQNDLDREVLQTERDRDRDRQRYEKGKGGQKR
ncbi:Liprin-beta-2 [Dissostichus eleginoides]|uniref:Liprin-beta-2 n=1 Tax=Dissostichus eleginoides TaxID=100907 RepID=A0AAD9BYL5_DISEL|nr:Liprin-beta-2 [Dissostichus eleginoides]